MKRTYEKPSADALTREEAKRKFMEVLELLTGLAVVAGIRFKLDIETLPEPKAKALDPLTAATLASVFSDDPSPSYDPGPSSDSLSFDSGPSDSGYSGGGGESGGGGASSDF